MRLHQIIHSVRDNSILTHFDNGLFEYNYSNKYLPLLNKSNHFYIGDESNIDKLIIQSEVLLDLNPVFYKLPYPITTFEFEYSESIGYASSVISLCFYSEYNDSREMLDKQTSYKDSEYLFSMKLFNKVPNGKVSKWMTVPLLLDFFKSSRIEHIIPVFKSDAFPDTRLSLSYNADHSRMIDRVLGDIVNFMVLLSCKNTYIKLHGTPDKKMSNRRKKGKTVLREYRTLELDLRNKETIKYMDSNNTGSPKRLHFRRGHIRRLQAGELIWVSHCLAGRKELGIIDKEYSLQNSF